MDIALCNFAYDDMRDPKFHIDATFVPELHSYFQKIINVKISIESIGFLTVD